MDKIIKFIPKQIRIERVSNDTFRLVGIDEVDLCYEEIQLNIGETVTLDTTWRFKICK